MAEQSTSKGQDRKLDDAFHGHLADTRLKDIPDRLLRLAHRLQDLLRRREKPD